MVDCGREVKEDANAGDGVMVCGIDAGYASETHVSLVYSAGAEKFVVGHQVPETHSQLVPYNRTTVIRGQADVGGKEQGGSVSSGTYSILVVSDTKCLSSIH